MNTDDSGPGSLRQALADANAAPGLDRIEFHADVTEPIALTSGEILILDSVEIVGTESRFVRIDAQWSSRVFYIENAAQEIDVTLSLLSIGAGTAAFGGCIANVGENLIIDRSGISDCHSTGDGGGIWADGPEMDLYIVSSSFMVDSAQGSGGALFVGSTAGPVIVERSDFRSSGAELDGGGIHVAGADHALTLDRSEIRSCYAGRNGGCVALENDGRSGGLEVRRSTFYGCSALNSGGCVSADTPGASFSMDSGTAANCFIEEGNGGSIYLERVGTGSSIRHSTLAYAWQGESTPASVVYLGDGGLRFDHTIIADHLVEDGVPYQGVANLAGAGSFSLRYSLLQVPMDTPFVDEGGNILDADPRLEYIALANGWPQDGRDAVVETLMPRNGTPVHDAGDPTLSAPLHDQRGKPRISNEQIDIGAVEFDMGVVEFESDTFHVQESLGLVWLKVVRKGGSDNIIPFRYVSNFGTATAEDFDAVDVSSGAGNLENVEPPLIDIPFIVDGWAEDDETFTVTLMNLDPADVLGSQRVATVIIHDDDSPPTISAIDDVQRFVGEPEFDINFTVGDEDSEGDPTVTAISSNADLVADAGLALYGHGAPRLLRVSPTTERLGSTLITLTVTDGLNSISESFTLAVIPKSQGADAGTTNGESSGAGGSGATNPGGTANSGGTANGDANTSGATNGTENGGDNEATSNTGHDNGASNDVAVDAGERDSGASKNGDETSAGSCSARAGGGSPGLGWLMLLGFASALRRRVRRLHGRAAVTT